MAIKFLNQVDVSGTAYLNGADNNSGKADFAVKAVGSSSNVSLSLRSGQFQVGYTDMNYDARLDVYSSDVVLRSWARNLKLTTDSSTTSHYISFTTANAGTESERMRITAAGNVGIGTTSPSYKLDVSGGKFRLSNSGTSQFYFNSTTSGSKEIVFQNNGTVVGYVWHNSSYIGVGKGSSSNSLFVSVSGNTEGRVGIGTASPGQKLHVDGNIRVGDANDVIYSNRFTTLSNANLQITANTGYDTLFTNGGSERMRIKTGGNVGIGTSNPANKLHVVGITESAGFVNNDVTFKKSFSLGNINAGTYKAIGQLDFGSVYQHHFKVTMSSFGLIKEYDFHGYQNALEKYYKGHKRNTDRYENIEPIIETIRNGSNEIIGVKIGIANNSTTSNDYVFTVTVECMSDFESWTNFSHSDTITEETIQLVRYQDLGGNTAFIDQRNGKVGIGTTTPAEKLHVSGKFVVDNNVGIGTTSPTNKLHVVGNIYSSGHVNANQYYVSDSIFHNADTDTKIKFDTDRIRIYAGGTTKFDTNNTYLNVANNSDITGRINIEQTGSNNGAITYDYDGGSYVPKPNGASYATSTSAHTGAIAIKLPTASWNRSDMVSFHVDIFDYNGGSVGESVSLYVYGYQYGTGNWTNCGAVVLSDRDDRDYTVRFGHDTADTRPIVWIGETTSTWNYLQITVRDFQAGYAAENDAVYDNGWDIVPNITSFETVIRTSDENYPVSKQWKDARTITLSGDLSGSTSIDGSNNVTLSATVADNSHNHSASNITSGTLPIARGGTNATTSSAARTNLGLGTAATSAATDFVAVTGDTMTGHLIFNNNVEIRQKDSGGTQRTIMELDSSNDLNIGGSYSGALKFMGGGSYSEVMRIHDDGNVGIGTTSPGFELDVYGVGTFGSGTSSQIAIGNYNDSFSGRYSIISVNNHGDFTIGSNLRVDSDRNYTTVNNHSQMKGAAITFAGNGNDYDEGSIYFIAQASGSATAGTEVSKSTAKMILKSGTGYLGIGTTSPTRTLSVKASSSSMVADFRSASGNNSFVSFSNNASTADQVRLGSTSGNLILSTNYTERVRVTSGGNVGIGTTSPSAKLVVKGSDSAADFADYGIVAFENQQSEGLSIGYDTGDNYSYLYSREVGVSSRGLRLNGSIYVAGVNGSVGIGTTSPVSNYKLHVDGTTRPALFDSTNAVSTVKIANNSTGNGTYNGLSLTVNSTSNNNINSYGMPLTFGTSSTNGTNVTERMRIDGSGNVGIGTTSPDEKLHVSGNVKASNYYVNDQVIHNGDTDTYIKFDTDRVRIYAGGTSKFDTNDSVMQQSTADLRYLQLSGGTMTGSISMSSGPSNGIIIGTNTKIYESSGLVLDGGTSTRPIGLRINGSEKMRVHTNGNVGIGTTSPAYTLDVRGKLNCGGSTSTGNYVRVEGSATENTYDVFYGKRKYPRIRLVDSINGDNNEFEIWNLGNQLRFGSSAGSSTDAAFYIKNGTAADTIFNGKVGIGTSSPSSKLQVNGTFRSNGISDSADALALWINGNEEVGIGTSSPTKKLDVSGTVRLKSSASELVIDNSTYSEMRYGSANYFRADGSQATVNGPIIKFRIGGTEKMRVHSNGNVGIANTNPSFPLTVSGAIKGGGKTTYTKIYSSLNTTGNAVAGLVSGSNGNSALFTFTMYGSSGAYQKIVYSCWNTGGTAWKVRKVIDEGTDLFDITVDAEAATRTFTFVTQSGTANYSPTVTVEHVGYSINTTYA